MHNDSMRHGQALVIVLLILALVSAVGLSVVSRTATEVNLSTTTDESSQALTAAEAGIESILANPLLPTGSANQINGSNSSFTVVSRSTAVASSEVSLSNSLKSGESATLFLRGYNELTGAFQGASYASTFIVCWGKPGAAEVPALEVTTYKIEADTSYSRTMTGYNGVSTQGFTFTGTPADAVCNPAGSPAVYAYKTGPINPLNGTPGTALFARVRLLYNETIGQPVKVVSGSATTFPPQGNIIDVMGSAGSTVRRIQVIEKYPDPPAIFDNAVYSGSSL